MRCRLGRVATGHFGGQRASLYPCAVPVPAGVAVPCSLPGLVAHALPVILPGFMVRALPPWSCGSRIFRRAVGHPCIPALYRFRYEGLYRVLCRGLWCCLSFCPDLWVSTGYSVLVYVHTLPPGRVTAGDFGGQRASLYSCIVPVPAGVAVPCSLPGLVAHVRCRLGRAATGHFGGQLGIPVSLRCAGSGRGGSTVFSAGVCGARAAGWLCGIFPR